MYCHLSNKYVNDHECDFCDSNAGYDKDTWKYTCDRVRVLHHPILNSVRWWLKSTAFKFKLFICIAGFVNFLKPKKRWFVHSNRSGLHVGVLDLTEFLGEPKR